MRAQQERDEQTVTITVMFVAALIVGLPVAVVLAVLASATKSDLDDGHAFVAAVALAAAWVAIGLARSSRS